MNDQPLLSALQSVCESSCVLSTGVTPPVIPGVSIAGLGPLSFPAVPEQIRQLQELAGQAPFGRGTETVVDTSVRNVWQLEPSQFRLTNDEWASTLDDTLQRVAEDFNLQQKIEASLYKLLLYAPGSFFLPHRDTEKAPGMFATLVFCLPSHHEGGELLVEHEGKTHTVDFAPRSAFRTQFAAFYADCRHEVKPVRLGYRLCLVYNLSLAGKRRPRAPQLEPAVPVVASALRELFSDGPVKVAIQLGHEYTSAGLSVDSLKGADRARFDVLALAAERENLECRLGLLSLTQEGEAEEYYERYYRGSRKYTIGEIYEESLTVSHLYDAKGTRREKGPLQVGDDELLLFSPIENLAFRRRVHEDTGNAGVTISRWYRTATALLWPRHFESRLWAAQGPRQALPRLRERILSGATREEQSQWARDILALWSLPLYMGVNPVCSSSRMLWCLRRIGDRELAVTFIAGPLKQDYDRKVGPALVRTGQELGWETVAPFFDQHPPSAGRTSVYLRITRQLCCFSPSRDEATWRAVAQQAVLSVLTHLRESDRERQLPLTEADLQNLFGALVALGADAELASVVDLFLRTTDLHRSVLPALRKLRAYRSLPAYTRLWQSAVDRLRESTSTPVVFPSDWAFTETRPGCNCEACPAVRTLPAR